MPGAPTGRACNACRKLKKKCDQKQPKCSRCVRLQVPCIGSGQLRYKFMGTSFGAPVVSSGNSSMVASPASPPSNNLSRLIDGFSRMLDVDDLGIDVSIYGPFFQDIPRRLGTSEALDDAALALVTAYPSVRTRQQTRDIYQACNKSICTVRSSLNDPDKALQPETLCAVYMTMIYQGWILRKDDFYAAHGDILVHLVNRAALGKHNTKFEQAVLVTLQVLVVIVSLIDSSIKPDLSIWDKLPEHRGPIPPINTVQEVESLKLENLVKVVRLVQDFESNIPGLLFAYDKIKADCEQMSYVLRQFEAKNPASLPHRVRRIHLRYQNCYSILLHLAMTLHRGLDLEGVLGDTKATDLDHFIMEGIWLTENSMQYRPLGSSNVPFCLTIAYAMTKDADLMSYMVRLIEDWEGDFDATNWKGVAMHARAREHERGWIYLTNGQF